MNSYDQGVVIRRKIISEPFSQFAAPAGVGPPTWTFDAAPAVAFPNFGSNPVIFNPVAIGSPSPTRLIILGIGRGGRNITSVTLDGHNAVLVKSAGTLESGEIWIFNDSAQILGSTANIQITCDFGPDLIGIAVGHFTGVNPTETATNSVSVGGAEPIVMGTATTIPAGGFGIAFLNSSIAGSQTATEAWSGGATQDSYAENLSGNALEVSMAHRSVAGAWTPSASGGVGNGFGFDAATMVVACWGP